MPLRRIARSGNTASRFSVLALNASPMCGPLNMAVCQTAMYAGSLRETHIELVHSDNAHGLRGALKQGSPQVRPGRIPVNAQNGEGWIRLLGRRVRMGVEYVP